MLSFSGVISSACLYMISAWSGLPVVTRRSPNASKISVERGLIVNACLRAASQPRECLWQENEPEPTQRTWPCFGIELDGFL